MYSIHLTAVLFVLVFTARVSYAANSCWAPPMFYGSECRSYTSIWGSPGLRVRYSISVNGNAGTLVCCQGYSPENGGFQGIGCGHGSFSGTVNWGNNLATPKIKCKGSPFGATLTWTH